MDILKAAKAVESEVIQMRRHFHENPELSGKEDSTIDFVCGKLTELGIEHVNVPNGGVIGFIEGSKKGKTVLLRADVDALPMDEDADNQKGPKVVVSKVKGAAHTCGHDAHTAMLLGAAKILNENKAELEGRVLLFFERGEEGGGNIYYLVKYIQDEKIEIDSCWGLHVHAGLETGKMAVLTGPALAGAMGFQVTVQGKGGHGARPDLAINPVDCYAQIHMAVNQMRVRYVNAFHPCSYTICMVDGGTKGNIVPDKVTFAGTCRYYHEEDALKFSEELKRIVTGTCEAFGCTPVFDRVSAPGLPVLNNAECAEMAREFIGEVMGKENVVDVEPKMGSESFSYLSTYYPSAYGFLGVMNKEKGMAADHHNPKFEPDEDSFVYGVAAAVAYAIGYLKDNRPVNFTPFAGDIEALQAKLGKK